MSDRDEIAKVLAAHRLHASMNICECRNWQATPNAGNLAGQHRLHLAAVLAERERRVKAEALRDAAAACRRMADQAEIDAGGKLERWDAFVEVEDWLCDKADRIEGQS